MTGAPSLQVKRGIGGFKITSQWSPRTGLLYLFAGLVLMAIPFSKSAAELITNIVIAILAVAATLAWWWAQPVMASRFRLDRRKIDVVRASPFRATCCTYDFEHVLLLEAESGFITARLLDGEIVALTHEHASLPELHQLVTEICDKTGLNSLNDVVVPDPQGRAVTFRGHRIGMSVEWPFAVLRIHGSKGEATTVFDHRSRQVVLMSQYLFARPAIAYREIASIGIEEEAVK